MSEIVWSAFPNGSTMQVGDQAVGLRAGVNVRFDFPGAGILDASGNYLLKWSSAGASAVNYITLLNSISSDPVFISASGADTNVGLILTTKNAGNLLFSPGTGGVIACLKSLMLSTNSPSTALEAASKGYVDSVTPTYPISLSQGGTNANLSASNGGIFYSTATAGAILAGTATANQVLLSGNLTTPSWSTATYPSSTTINQILYSSSNNVIAGISTGNNGALITSAGGVPSISSTLPSAVQTNITSLGTISSGTWNGNVIAGQYGGTGVSNTGKTITLGGSLVTSGAFDSTFTMTNTTSVTFPTSGTLATTSQIPSFPLSLANGGTNANLTASNGGIFYSTATAGAILAGTATANQILLSGSSTTPAWSTATYPATTTVSQLLYSSSNNVIAGLATANSAALVTNSAGVPVFSSTMTNGQLIIGSTGGTPGAATLTAGSGITITNGAGSITLASSGSGVDWTTVTGSTQQIVNNQGYIANSGSLITFTLPVTAAVGTIFAIQGKGTGGWKITYNANQSINIANIASTPTTGSVASTGALDSAFFICVAANTTWEPMAGFTGTLLVDNTYSINTANIGSSSPLSVGFGGTGNTTFTAYTLICAGTTATGAFQNVSSVGTANQLLKSNGASALPSFTTATYPSTTTANQLLYSSSANTIAGLSTVNTAILTTNGSGVPAWSTTPIITQINGANGEVVAFTSPSMSVNYATISASASFNDVSFGANGTDTDVSIQYAPKGAGVHTFITTANTALRVQSGTGYQRLSTFTFGNTSATYDYTFPSASGTLLMTGQAISTVPSIAFSSTSGVIGTTTNDSAAAGSVGEVISSTVLFSSAVSLTTGVGADLTSISLTAGDWDVWGSASFSTVGAFNYVLAGVSVNSGVTPDASMCAQLNLVGPTVVGLQCPTLVYKLNSTTTVYLAVNASFTVNGDVCGTLFARRRR